MEIMARTLKKDVDVNGEKLLFQLFFLKDDEDQNVEIEEVEKVDFEKVTQRVKRGDSVFITSKRKEKMETSLVAREIQKNPGTLITSKEGEASSSCGPTEVQKRA